METTEKQEHDQTEKQENDQTEKQENGQTEDTLQIKCESCGGVMRYSPTKQNLKCVYCGCEKPLDNTPVKIKSFAFDEWCCAEETKELSEQMQSVPKVTCKQCGAVTTLAENVSSANCPFCGSSLILHQEQVNRTWKPGAILPFKIEEKQCKEFYKKWLSGKWYAPSKLRKNVASPTAFRGVYLPFWAYDADTHTFYTGQQGVEYSKTVERDGKRETVTETEWTHVQGTVNQNFENVLVPAATNTVSSSMVRKLSNWDLENSVAYREEYVSGFVTELYTKDFVESIKEAKAKMESVIDDRIKKNIGGDHQSILSKDIDYQDVMFKLLLLPIWISSFTYNGKVYQFVVNGRTGEIKGKYPHSIWKIIFTCIIAIVCIAVIYYLISGNF